MSELTTNIPEGNVLSPEVLGAYASISPMLPNVIMQEWSAKHRRAFWYATLALTFGGLLALSLVGGFVYLVMRSQGGYAVTLLGTGALSMVAGFRSSRLEK